MAGGMPRDYRARVWTHAHEGEQDDADPERSRPSRSHAEISVARLQQTVGNAVIARLLGGRRAQSPAGRRVQRSVESEADASAPAVERIREINARAWVGPFDELELELQWNAVPDLERGLLEPQLWTCFTDSVDAGMDPDKVAGCTALVKIWLVLDERATPERAEDLADLWGSYGSGMVEMAQQYLPTWESSLEHGMDPDDIAAIEEIKRTLEDDVRTVAAQYLALNLAAVREERERLGVGVGVAPPAADAAAARDELVYNAQAMRELLIARDQLRGIAVGREHDEVASDDGAPDDEDATAADPRAMLFDPVREPDLPPEPGDEMLPWAVVNSMYELATAGLMAVAATSPVLYGAFASGRLDELDPAAAPEDVAATAHLVLFELQTNILRTRENLEGDLDWHLLGPIIGELADGRLVEGGSGVDWSASVHASLLRDEMADHATVRALQEMAWLIPAVALMFTPLGWPVMVAGGLLSAAEVAHRYQRWDELRSAAGAAASPDTRLVEPGEARAAEADLILSTVFAFLGAAADVGALALRARTARGAGAALGGLDAAPPGAAVARATPAERAAALQRRHPKIDDGTGSMGALEEIFRRTGATGPDDYLPIHTRAHSAELKTIIRHATDPAVARVELVPSSSGARTPDLILDVLEADGTTRRTRVEIRTLIGTTAGPKSRGAAGARPGTVDDIVSAVSSKAKDSPGARRSQLAVPMLDVPTGGTLAIHLPFAGPDAVLDVAAAMKKLERTLADAKHVEAIEFYLPGGVRVRYARDADGPLQAIP